MSLLSNHQIHTGGFVAGHPGNKIVKYEAAQQPEPLSFLLNVTSQREELEFCSQVAVYSRCRIVLKEAKPSLSFQPKKREGTKCFFLDLVPGRTTICVRVY